jgi:hypothetical protein
VISVAQRELSLLVERYASVGRAHAGGGALQQARAELTLKATQLLAEGRGDHAQVLGSVTHAARLHDTNEIA